MTCSCLCWENHNNCSQTKASSRPLLQDNIDIYILAYAVMLGASAVFASSFGYQVTLPALVCAGKKQGHKERKKGREGCGAVTAGMRCHAGARACSIGGLHARRAWANLAWHSPARRHSG